MMIDLKYFLIRNYIQLYEYFCPHNVVIHYAQLDV